jgi:anti-anti-sigma regulatory factor
MRIVGEARKPLRRYQPGRTHVYECNGARVVVDLRSAALVSAAISGEVDASSAAVVMGYIRDVVSADRPVVLDLSTAIFCSAQAIRELVAFGSECAGLGVAWVVVSNPTLDRILESTGRDNAVP